MSDFTPPSSPDLPYEPLAEPPVWPKVIGIISIVLGSLGLTCTGCSVIGMLVFMPMLEQQVGEPLPPPQRPDALLWGITGIGLALAALLLIAGIVTVMRRAEGRSLHLVYAIANIPMTIFSAAVQINRLNAAAQWAANNPDSQWAQQQNAPGAQAGQWGGLIVGLALGLAYPVFLLIWFGFVKRRPEDMTGDAPLPAA